MDDIMSFDEFDEIEFDNEDSTNSSSTSTPPNQNTQTQSSPLKNKLNLKNVTPTKTTPYTQPQASSNSSTTTTTSSSTQTQKLALKPTITTNTPLSKENTAATHKSQPLSLRLLKTSPQKKAQQPQITNFFTVEKEPQQSLFDRFKNEDTPKKPTTAATPVVKTPISKPKPTIFTAKTPDPIVIDSASDDNNNNNNNNNVHKNNISSSSTTAVISRKRKEMSEQSLFDDIDFNEEEEVKEVKPPITPVKKVPATPTKSPLKKTPAKKKPAAKKKSEDSDYESNEEVSEDDGSDDYQSEEETKPKTNNRKKLTRSSQSSSSSSSQTKETPTKKGAFGKTLNKEKLEERYQFLVNIQDANQRGMDHPDYDPRTLYIPPKYLSNFSPFERQFWEIKSKYYDTIVFFKKGKFYELYESDAQIGHQLLGLKMTDRVNMKMVGVPEASFTTWAAKLIKEGYKVTKVDQMESAIGQKKRLTAQGGGGKTDSIIKREVSSILTPGTLLDESLITDLSSTFLMAIKEEESTREYGICLVDTSIGEFHLTTFKDDEARMQFETVLLQTMPKEIIYERNATSTATLSIVKRVLASVRPILNARNSLTEYWDPEETLNKIKENRPDKELPETLLQHKNEVFTMCALGACVSYLFEIKIGEELCQQGRFQKFSPLDIGNTMILDAQCLVNLEIFNNTTDGSTEGTLLKLMDRCQTAFGKRLLRQWICRPLANLEKIKDRQRAIEYFHNNHVTLQSVQTLLQKLPDLERKLSRIHAKSSKISDINSVLNHFETIHYQIGAIQSGSQVDDEGDVTLHQEISSVQLRNCLTFGKGCYPDLRPAIDTVKNSFTLEGDQLLPTEGAFKEFDECKEKLDALVQKLEEHIQEIRVTFKCPEIEYKHMGKEIYQIEIPLRALTRAKIPDNYTKLSEATKTCQRFHSPFILKILPQLLEERDTLQVLSREFLKKVQEIFNEHYNLFQDAIRCLANLDCLLSLYKVSCQSTISMCKPEFVSDNKAFLSVKDMVHPCISARTGGEDFIPNDLNLNCENHPSTMVITGPNMGGKSTMLRQTCLVAVMAQLGCYVPASECKLSVVDRIFTRLGANDNIMAGQSTFMVELQEAGNVLKYATPRSLVIMDELGRGTSTFDGYSIAYSVLKYIVLNLHSMCLFATHYQSLANEPTITSHLAKSFMSCNVDQKNKRVIFSYKLKEGVCPNSYGLLVAAMSGLPNVVTQLAEEKAIQFEKESTISTYIHGTIHKSELVKKIQTAYKNNSLSDLKLLQSTLK
ncbi:hypothetical protein DLAC_01262 [Tieghemostelium lacteum]|uniref:DNA mismatch repair protein n=1 Tax=Tieghemostelium lacteum TaxID=361077 RepID=A0A152A862_TIELA|nr:hypothetical protein DLAC_01262 [Tieghemostelium lacteum]|eukprot:KYR02422.1 hypothetical protein DLAC_01262 [Tieghemostelium lacteum]